MVNGVYLVTGAGSGIGAATARRLVERGARVGVADIDGEAADRLDAELGDAALSVPCDVTDPTSVGRAIARCMEMYGQLDGAVCNAGIVRLDTAWESTFDDWNRQLEVNIIGTFVTARAVGEHLRRSGGGSIVNVASNAGKVGYPNMAAYSASKAAVINLTRSLAQEWAPDNINVNAVCPGGVDTPMLAGVAEWLSPRLGVEADELLADMGPAQLGRRVAPEEVAAVIAFLLSDDARIIRGQSINVDGGDTPY